MRCKAALLVAIMLLEVLLVETPHSAATGGITYWTFDRQQWLTALGAHTYSSASSNTLLYSGTFSLATPGYPVFLYLDISVKATLNVSFTQKMKIIVSTPSSTILSKTISFPVNYSTRRYTYRIPISPTYTAQVKVELILEQTNYWSHITYATINLLRLLIVDDNGYSYNTSLDLSKLPPISTGKGGGGLALNINRTELTLTSPKNLTSGSLGLQLMWNGGNVNITPWLAINESGNIYMQFGKERYVSTIPLNKSEWEDVYIGWESGNAYIAIGNDIMTFSGFNWTVPLSTFGSTSQNATLLLDTVAISTTYLPPSSIELLMGLNNYYILYRNLTVTISPESIVGQLGILSVSFLSANLSTLNTTILSPQTISATAPNTARYIVLSANGVSRMYALPATDIAFPSVDQQVLVAKIGVTPGTWQSVIVKTPNGKIAYSGPLEDNAFQFAAVQGAIYLITFRSGNVSVTRVTQVTGDMEFYVARASPIIKPPIAISASYTDGTLKVEYYDAQNTTAEHNSCSILKL